MPRLKRFLTDVKAGRVPQTLWPYSEVGHTQEAKKELIALVDFPNSDVVFDTPKPTRLIRRILQLATKPENTTLVVDFFAGTGSTMDAVFRQNATTTAEAGTRSLRPHGNPPYCRKRCPGNRRRCSYRLPDRVDHP